MQSIVKNRLPAGKVQRTAAPKLKECSFHLIKPEYAGNALSRALQSGLISKDDNDLINQFILEAKGEHNFRVGHANKITYDLIRWRYYLGEYRKNTYTDVLTAIDTIQKKPVRTAPHEGEAYKKNTLKDLIAILKKFYLWLVENEISACKREKILKIKIPHGDMMTKTAEQCFSEAEILAMIKACIRPIDKALISVLYDGGLRIGELATLTWGQVKVNEYTIVINTDGKTGKPRKIPLTLARPYLLQWKSDYPFPLSDDALVFMNRSGDPLKHAGVTKHIREIVVRAGIPKHVTAHLYRHTRVTELARKGYSETAIKDIVWGNRGSKMLETYNHMNFEDVEREVMEKNGIKAEPRQKDPLLVQQCRYCATVNTPTSHYCSKCGHPLSDDETATIEQLTSEIEGHPVYKYMAQQLESMKKQIASGAVTIG